VWYLIGIDLIDAHKISKKGNKFILTMTDYFTKYVEGCPIPDKSANSVERALYSTFCRHGSPAHIISDQGREFVNQVPGFSCFQYISKGIFL
jgi:IS30 family transposase